MRTEHDTGSCLDPVLLVIWFCHSHSPRGWNVPQTANQLGSWVQWSTTVLLHTPTPREGKNKSCLLLGYTLIRCEGAGALSRNALAQSQKRKKERKKRLTWAFSSAGSEVEFLLRSSPAMAITDPGCVRIVTSEETVILVIGRPPSFFPRELGLATQCLNQDFLLILLDQLLSDHKRNHNHAQSQVYVLAHRRWRRLYFSQRLKLFFGRRSHIFYQ